MNNLCFTILGRVGIKKNQKQIWFNKRTGRPFITTSQKFKTYESVFSSQVPLEARGWGKEGDSYSLHVRWQGDYTQDADNVLSSVCDLLCDNQVIHDDRRIETMTITREYAKKDKQGVIISLDKIEMV